MNTKIKFIGAVWDFTIVIVLLDLLWLFGTFGLSIELVFYEGDYAIILWIAFLVNFCVLMMVQPVLAKALDGENNATN